MKLDRFRNKFFIVVLCTIGTGCSRNEPDTTNTQPPSGIPEIRPIASYFIGEHAPEPSGIVYNAKNNSLMIVSDSHPELYEFDFQGKLLHTITTVSTDLEGIALSKSNDTVYVVEEKNRLVAAYRTDGSKLASFSADVATLPNNALEGITVGKNGNLFVVNEKLPGMLLEYLPDGTEVRRMTLTFASDYSDIFYDESEDRLWIISDESMKVAKIDMNGTLVSQWLIPFSKGEGISIVRDTMYIVNDADAKMYVFVKPK